ncbi:MAG TPA: ABC transporter permease, partial [Bryobacteraceae bacterium]|nr:ABC transporter permease [Bryobacteraceae bacterium]
EQVCKMFVLRLMRLPTGLRFAARTIGKNPAFSAIAIATLALGIGANTAIFSVVDSVILRPLTYPAADRLVSIHEVVPKFSNIAPMIPVNAMHFREWRKSVHSFDQLAMLGSVNFNLTGTGEPVRIHGARVSPALFEMLGVRPQLGRLFSEAEDQPGRDLVVLLNDELWRRQFAADPGVIGRKISVNGQPYEIVGVLPSNFHFPKMSQLFAMPVAEERPELWKPFAVRDDELDALGDFNYAVIARLRPGAGLQRALSELNIVQAQLMNQAPEKIELRAALVPLQDQITGKSRSGLMLMLAAVGAVLLIGCVNITNLLLARATARRREIGIRCALGAGSGRLVRQMLQESLLLSGLGGAFGFAVAYAAIRLIVAYAPVDLPRIDEIHLDTRVLIFTIAISTLAGLLSGILPAWRFANVDPQEAMRTGSRSMTAGRSSGRLRALLVSLEAGLSALCLIAGGLLLHSFVKLLQVDRGFEAERVITVTLNLPGSRYSTRDKRTSFLHSVLDKVTAVPGVVSAGVSNMLPLGGEGANNLVALEGSKLPLMERPLADIRQVNPGYFRTMGIPLRAGRVFADSDRERQVALVSIQTAERLWPGQNPIDKRFHIGDDNNPNNPLMTVAGVVGDVHGASLSKKPSLTIYIPYWQRNFNQDSVVVKTAMDPRAASAAIRGAIRQVDPELPVPAFQTMDEVVSGSVSQNRFQMNLVLLFAVVAMLLASLGIYGVVSYSVAQRSSEMGIRLALGARPGAIRGMVLGQALRPVMAGLGAGVLASLALGRLFGSLLFGVSAVDPITIVSVVALLSLVAAAASYLPARRATRIDPLIALRYE